MHTFDPDVVDQVLAHMNGDHLDDNLLIVRANGAPQATAASMSDVDGEAGTWTVVGPEGPIGAVRIPWPSGPITQRAEIRREVVALYDAACAALGVDPGREH
ncbi:MULTISPECIES: DUF2470 domain-containing protein [Nocardioides]|uniref:DUF2470 domain-containing protein n=1 Tax=Nocardioides vastitatis TaxID=2568655 RepID=A0ABW0ZMU3_9ACTN|nr:DUF2470 domain-containing protein [Nocardioides sp.]THJ06711.1 DUF2470 domain-containing protein [Nocardioides sp.]